MMIGRSETLIQQISPTAAANPARSWGPRSAWGGVSQTPPWPAFPVTIFRLPRAGAPSTGQSLTFASRRLGFSRADEITIVFCGSKKSLANGVPIATLLFAGHVGLVILPVMVFQQIQLMVCASLAGRYAARRTPPDPLAGLPAAAGGVEVA